MSRSRLLVVLSAAAATLAACSPAPADPPSPGSLPSAVELGSFTGEIDMESGVVTIRSDDGRTAGGRGAISEITAISVANAGTPDRANRCADLTASLGVNVRIAANPYVSTNLFTDVYAQIETLNGTGTEGCNSVTPPGGSGLSNAKGLWYYPSLGGSNGVTAYWAFAFKTGTKSTFSGKVYGTATPVTDIKMVFVTSTHYTGNVGGLAGADVECQSRANAGITAGFLPAGSTYTALVSSSTVNAIDRIVDAAYVRPDGRVISAGKSELFATGPRVPLQVTELGTTYVPPTAYPYAMTGSLTNGTHAIWTCSGFTSASSSDYGAVGEVDRVDDGWVNVNELPAPRGYARCDLIEAALYCFQE